MFIAGGSRGIGAAIARLAAQRGHDVAFTYARETAAADQVVRDIETAGRRALAIKANMGSEEDIVRSFAEVDARLGSPQSLIVNSGITGPNSRLDEASSATLREVIDVNLLGSMFCAREAIRRMSTKHGGSGGSIVFISSRASVYGAAGEFVWYAASKGGIDSLSIGLAREVGREGIRVNVISPGPIDTQMHRPGRLQQGIEKSAMGRAGKPEEVAEAALFLASPLASYCNGANFAVAGGA
jgi:NAD(P)-dependent dehydrogenase (short-subunit alcohol dehydrogenase family)